MTRLKKELTERGIIYDADEYMIMMGPEHDEDARLVSITDKFLITVVYSAVLDPVLYLYDRKTLKRIAYQNLYPETMFFGQHFDKWMSWVE